MRVPRYRLIFIGALLLAGAAYVDESPRQETSGTVARITPEEARAALLRVEGPGLGLTDLERTHHLEQQQHGGYREVLLLRPGRADLVGRVRWPLSFPLPGQVRAGSERHLESALPAQRNRLNEVIASEGSLTAALILVNK